MDRYWLATSTFYGTWLPGDRLGFVGSVRETRSTDPRTPLRLGHDIPGTPYDAAMDGLERASAESMRGPPVYIESPHAAVLVRQFRATADHRRWHPLAAAVMANHVHLVVGTPFATDPTKMLGDFKAYGSWALAAAFGRPAAGTWWTRNGSKRWLRDDDAVAAGVRYVLRKQYRPLATWAPGMDTPDDRPASAGPGV